MTPSAPITPGSLRLSSIGEAYRFAEGQPPAAAGPRCHHVRQAVDGISRRGTKLHTAPMCAQKSRNPPGTAAATRQTDLNKTTTEGVLTLEEKTDCGRTMPSPMLTITKNLYDHRKPNATPMRSHIALRYKQTYFVIAGAKMITLDPILSSILPQANLPTPIR